MIISISGTAGSGKSTVAKILAEKLGYKRYYIGGIRRELAKKQNMTIEEFNKLGEKDISTDKVVDDYQKKIGETEDNFIIEGRVSFYFIPKSFKIYMYTDINTAGKRIHTDKLKESGKDRNEKIFNTVQETITDLKERANSDKIRYKKYYNIDCYNHKNYDYTIDTTNITVTEAVNNILKEIEKR